MTNERFYYNAKGEKQVVPYDLTPIVKHTKTLDTSFQGEITRLKGYAELQNSGELWRNRTRIDVQSNRPIFPIMPLSDLHLGHRGVDYAALERRLAFAREYDVKIILLGDIIDGFIPGKLASGMVDQAPIRDQVRTATAMLREYQDLILCNVSTPHHDGWTYQLTGVDLHEFMAKDLDIPLIESGGSVSIAINEVPPYELAVFHKIKQYNSSLNLTNASKRVVQLHGEYDPDLVMSGHVHKSSVEVTKQRGKKRGLIVCGTLKGNDKYGQREGYIGGVDIDAFPVVFLRTDEKDFTVVESMKQAGEFIDGVNLLYSTYANIRPVN